MYKRQVGELEIADSKDVVVSTKLELALYVESELAWVDVTTLDVATTEIVDNVVFEMTVVRLETAVVIEITKVDTFVVGLPFVKETDALERVPDSDP